MRTSGGPKRGSSPDGPSTGRTDPPYAGRTNGKERAQPSPDTGGARGALLQALDDYRAGGKDLEEAAAEAGVPSWDLLEAVQATPDPMVDGMGEPSGLQPFVRRRED